MAIQTVYKYIEFVRTDSGKAKTQKWYCMNRNHGERLGVISWYGAWRQYCYEPICAATYSAGCLKDIADFIGQLQAEHAAAQHD